uniref:Uncharacterized protein n=1 Tax=Steinernema glaseri TaxID=37863 RepID=A0A1I7YWB5_9BILA
MGILNPVVNQIYIKKIVNSLTSDKRLEKDQNGEYMVLITSFLARIDEVNFSRGLGSHRSNHMPLVAEKVMFPGRQLINKHNQNNLLYDAWVETIRKGYCSIAGGVIVYK